MPWAAAGAVAGGLLAGEASKNAAKTSANASKEAIAEQRRQFDIGQENLKPWQKAGEEALGRYEGFLGKQGDYEQQIQSNIPGQFTSSKGVPAAYNSETNIPDAFQSRTNIPTAYRNASNIPQAYSEQAGDYFGNVQNNVQQGFKFGRNEFDQYKDPGYDFRKEEGIKALERRNAKGGNRNSGYNTRSLMELGQNLGSDEFNRARNRAYDDYQSNVDRESQRYGRSVSDYDRRVGREDNLYGRGRQQRLDEGTRESSIYNRGSRARGEDVLREQGIYDRGRQLRTDQSAVEQGRFNRGRQYTQDQTRREQELYGRSLRDYGLDVNREESIYNRGVARYGRQYTDMANREASLANVGQTTASEVSRLGANSADNIAELIQRSGDVNAAGQLGEAGAYAGALGSAGSSLQQYYNPRSNMRYGTQVEGDAYQPGVVY